MIARDELFELPCRGNTGCGRRCGWSDMHCGPCDCRERWCPVCCGLVDRTPLPPTGDPTAQHEWIQTFTGRAVRPLDPDPADIVVEDIAHALAHQCRFTGHTRGFYSTAQHSVLMTLVLPKELGLEALFHDSYEAYLFDLARPVKYHPSLRFYRLAEDAGMRAVRHAFRLRSAEPDEVKAADKRMLPTERRDLMGPCPAGHRWQETPPPYDLKIVPWPPDRAERMFLAVARELRPMGAAGELPAWGSLRGKPNATQSQLTRWACV